MKVYTEVNYIWKDDKLVQTDSKSYEYEGEVELCHWYHRHSNVSISTVTEAIPDNPAELLNNVTDLGGDILNTTVEGGGDILSTTVDLGGDVLNEGVSIVTGGADLNEVMTLSTNIFAETGNVLGKGGLFTNDLIDGIVNGDWTGANAGKHGLFGMGTPNLPIPDGPNLTQPMFQATNLGDNINWLGGKLAGQGYIHDRLNAGSTYINETLGHVMDFLGNPKDYMVNDQLANMLLNQSGIVSAFGGKGFGGDGGGGGLGGGDDDTSKYVKGRGTMKGRSPTLKLNKGGKGLGRKSLRIGTGGMGQAVGGKFKTFKSGRYTRVH
jgi:hypothetical protein